MHDMIILGENACFDTDPIKTGLNANVLCVGSPGTGKTRYIVEPTLTCANEDNLVVTCTKRRIHDEYAPILKKKGYRVLTLDMTRPKDSDIAYDPLQFVESFNDIKALAEMVVMADPRKKSAMNTDPYWDQSAISLLCAEITYVIMSVDDPKFSDILQFHNRISFSNDSDASISTTVDEVFLKLALKDPDNFAVTSWRTFSNLPRRTAGSVISTLSAAMEQIFSPDIIELISSKPCIDFNGFSEQKGALFLITSPVAASTSAFTNLFYGQLFKSLFEMAEKEPDGVLKRHVRVIADDFATGGKVVNFAENISIMREKGVSFMAMIQSQSQLSSIYGEDDETTIINGFDTYVYLGGMDIKTCKDISVRIDKPLAEVLSMEVGKEFIFRRGSKPLETVRFDISGNREAISAERKYPFGFRSAQEERE